jgi:hypothetical protein
MKNHRHILRSIYMTCIFGMISFFPGLIIYGGVHSYLKSQATLNWPKAEGEITHSEIRSRGSCCKNKSNYPEHTLWFNYRFYVNGKQYQHEDHYFHTGDKNRLKPLLKIYKKDKKLPVFYDPRNPSNNALQRGGWSFWNGMTTVGSFLLVTFWLIFWITCKFGGPVAKTGY